MPTGTEARMWETEGMT